MIAKTEGIHGWTPPAAASIRTNYSQNPDGELAQAFTNASEYVTTSVVAAEEGVSGLTPLPTGGVKVDKSVFATASNAGFIPYTFVAAGTWTVSVFCFMPANWNGGDIALKAEGYTASIQSNVAALASEKGSWRRIATTVEVAAGDLVGNLVLRPTAPSSVGRAIYFSGVLIEPGDTVNSYFPTALQLTTQRAAWTGTAHASTSTFTAPAVELGRIKDDVGALLWPRYTIDRVTGLGSTGEVEDNRDRPPGAQREEARRSVRRGKTVTYEGKIKARSLFELRQAEDALTAAFDNVQREGRMDVTWHQLLTAFGDETAKFYEARALASDVVDAQTSELWDRLYVVGLRMGDRRYFEESHVSHSVEIANTNTAYKF